MELINADITLLIFFIPSLLLLRNIEKNVVTPIIEFSEIKDFIKENEKIESESLIEIYSKYADYDNEIGSLARSYTNLIKIIMNISKILGRLKEKRNVLRLNWTLLKKFNNQICPHMLSIMNSFM